jgi:hypothetical protein
MMSTLGIHEQSKNEKSWLASRGETNHMVVRVVRVIGFVEVIRVITLL